MQEFLVTQIGTDAVCNFHDANYPNLVLELAILRSRESLAHNADKSPARWWRMGTILKPFCARRIGPRGSGDASAPGSFWRAFKEM